MKGVRFLSIIFAAFGLMFLGCEKSSDSPLGLRSDQDDVGSLAKATTVTTNITSTFDVTLFVPCAVGGAGEFVHVSGPLKELFHVTLDGNGGFHLTNSFNPQGVSGVGLTSGDKYQATGGTRETLNALGLPFETSFVNNFRFIGQGPGNNFLVHENFHLTINANGTVTSTHDNLSSDCK